MEINKENINKLQVAEKLIGNKPRQIKFEYLEQLEETSKFLKVANLFIQDKLKAVHPDMVFEVTTIYDSQNGIQCLVETSNPKKYISQRKYCEDVAQHFIMDVKEIKRKQTS